jgi:hypothetical protein
MNPIRFISGAARGLAGPASVLAFAAAVPAALATPWPPAKPHPGKQEENIWRHRQPAATPASEARPS